MIGLLVRLTILFAVVFGIVYGLVGSARRKHARNLEEEKKLVLERIRALADAKARGELTQEQADELTWQVYLESKDKGIDLAREEVELSEGALADRQTHRVREMEPQD